MTEGIIIAVLSLLGTLGGSYFANKRSSALIAYRLEELEKKVDKHNSVIERTYELEEAQALLAEKIKVAWKTGDTSPLAYLIPAVFAELATATGFYYSKAKAENRIKLRQKYGPEIYNDSKEV